MVSKVYSFRLWGPKERQVARDLEVKQRAEKEQRRQDENLRKLKIISPETSRQLRDLIRVRYELDLEI